MTVALGADHAGFTLKKDLAATLVADGHEVLDLGVYAADPPSDYPDVAELVALAVRDGKAERGILVCGSGAGAAIAADKIPGIRCASATDTYTAHQAVEHDAMNVLAIGSRVVGTELAHELVRAFIGASFLGAERFLRRLDKVLALESRHCGTAAPKTPSP